MLSPKPGVALLFTVVLAGRPAQAGKPPFEIKRAPESSLNRLELTQKAVERLGIKTGIVAQKAIPRTLTLPGRITSRPGSAAIISAPFAGTLAASGNIPVPGTKIIKGQTVLKLRPLVAPGRHLLVEAQRDLAQAKTRRSTAEKVSARAKTLLTDGAGDQAALDRATEALALAEAELSAARVRIKQLKRDPLNADVSMPVRAPANGVVLRLFTVPGQAVAAGERLVELMNFDHLWLRVSVYVGRLHEINRTAIAQARPFGQNKSHHAKPVDAPPLPTPNGTVVELAYALNGGEGLLPGARVMAQLRLLGDMTPTLTVPWPAVFYDVNGAAWVYAAIDRRTFERRRVDVETIVDQTAVLSAGPKVGTPVVIEGSMELFAAEFGIGK